MLRIASFVLLVDLSHFINLLRIFCTRTPSNSIVGVSCTFNSERMHTISFFLYSSMQSSKERSLHSCNTSAQLWYCPLNPFSYLQVITVFILECVFLGFLCWIRPYMNKQTNGFAISIAAINAFNMLLMIFFSNIFGLPGLANGILGVVWFVVNAVFALV